MLIMANEDLKIPWRTVAIGSLLINLGTVGTVAAVATINGSDALATVALALAIIAFICQLIIFSVQTWQSGEQLRQAQELNSATGSLLGEVRARIEGTHQMVSTQYQELLHLTTLKLVTDTTKSATEVADLEEKASRAVEPEAASRTELAVQATATEQSVTTLGDQAVQMDDAERTLKSLNKLNKKSLEALALNCVTGALGYAIKDEWPINFNTLDDTSEANGLIVRNPRNEKLAKFTPAGVRAVQLIAAPTPIPNSLMPISDAIKARRGALSSSATRCLQLLAGDAR
jgi:DNA uptake protein ComE-like DNA-binding protein